MENTTENKELIPRGEKVFFASGDIVEFKHAVSNRPTMVVLTIDKMPIKEGDRVALLGVTCMWFSTDNKLQKSRFSTKDIIKVNPK